MKRSVTDFRIIIYESFRLVGGLKLIMLAFLFEEVENLTIL